MLSVSHKYILNQRVHFNLSRHKMQAATGHSEVMFPYQILVIDFHKTEIQKFLNPQLVHVYPSKIQRQINVLSSKTSRLITRNCNPEVYN